MPCSSEGLFTIHGHFGLELFDLAMVEPSSNLRSLDSLVYITQMLEKPGDSVDTRMAGISGRSYDERVTV
ncbi:hypothetical protein ACHAQI_009553 [Fusarium lateritium]